MKSYRHCSFCGIRGHNSRTCKLKASTTLAQNNVIAKLHSKCSPEDIEVTIIISKPEHIVKQKCKICGCNDHTSNLCLNFNEEEIRYLQLLLK